MIIICNMTTPPTLSSTLLAHYQHCVQPWKQQRLSWQLPAALPAALRNELVSQFHLEAQFERGNQQFTSKTASFPSIVHLIGIFLYTRKSHERRAGLSKDEQTVVISVPHQTVACLHSAQLQVPRDSGQSRFHCRIVGSFSYQADSDNVVGKTL